VDEGQKDRLTPSSCRKHAVYASMTANSDRDEGSMSKIVTALLVGSGLVLGVLPAQAQDGTLIRNFLGGIGVLPTPQEEIDYRARAPLVVPPAMKLQEPSAPAAVRTSKWPNDPDVAARKAAAKDALIPATEREKYIMGQRPLLSQEEIQRGRVNTPPITTPQRSAMDQSPYEIMTQPIFAGKEIAAQKNSIADSQAALGTEPPRRYLSDPPPGLRKPVGNGDFTRTRDEPAPVESRFGQQEFTASEARR
jgi:hypothetical protein